MSKILRLLLLALFILAGGSPVPACYATRPDCPVRGTFSCPLAAGMDHMPGPGMACPLSRRAKKDRPALPYSTERLKRLQFEQIQPLPIDLPTYVPIMGISLQLRPLTGMRAPRWASSLPLPLHRRPPPIFLRQQSFLI